jgi:excisionase family DNA binding protein
MMNGSAVLLTAADVAATLCVSRTTVWRLVKRGDLPTIRIGGSVRYAQKDVEALVALGRTVAPNNTERAAGRPRAGKTPARHGRDGSAE